MSQNNVQRTYKDSLFRMIFREKKEWTVTFLYFPCKRWILPHRTEVCYSHYCRQTD